MSLGARRAKCGCWRIYVIKDDSTFKIVRCKKHQPPREATIKEAEKH